MRGGDPSHTLPPPLRLSPLTSSLAILCTPVFECSGSGPVDDLLNIDDPYFEGMVSQIYPAEMQLNKAYASIPRPRF